MPHYQHDICGIGRIMAPKVVHLLIPRTSEYVTLRGKRGLADVIKLKILSWGDYPGLSQWAQCNHKGPPLQEHGRNIREAEVCLRQLLALKMEEGTRSQGMWKASRNRKNQGNRFSPRSSGRNTLLPTP